VGYGHWICGRRFDQERNRTVWRGEGLLGFNPRIGMFKFTGFFCLIVYILFIYVRNVQIRDYLCK